MVLPPRRDFDDWNLRVVVTGGRTYARGDIVLAALSSCARAHPNAAMLVAQGGARGADALALQFQLQEPLAFLRHVTFPAHWDQHGKRAGMMRNREMLDAVQPHFVLAFPGGTGTEGCVAEAIKRSIHVVRAPWW